MINNANVGLPTSSIMTGLLTQRRKSEFNKMSSQLFLKETEEGKYYRLRLLNTTPNQKFVTSSNFQHYRDFPFIIQHVHTVWSDIPTDDPNKTKRICKTIVCPQTDYVKANSTLSKAQCPMCAAYGSAWKAYKDSGYKNIEAKNKMKNLHNTQVVRVLVYVVQDPNYDSNNGAVKVLSLDEDAYQALLTQINASAKNNTPIWNNDSCDLFFTWGKFDKTVNEGKPNEYTFKKNGFTRIGFTTSPKHLDGLTDELVDSVQFDANWYQVPSKEELDTFYVENFSSQASSNDDIPMDIPPAAPVAKPAHVKEVKAAPAPVVDIVTPEVPVEPKETKKEKAIKTVSSAPVEEDLNARIDDILAGMSIS